MKRISKNASATIPRFLGLIWEAGDDLRKIKFESAANLQYPMQPHLPHLPMLNLKKAQYILFAFLLGATPTLFAQAISITIAPPPLVVYEQPACPEDGYFWNPGYWAYGDDDYFWVPGTWVRVPQPGYLWTPGYWGFGDGYYRWHGGYWGPHIGFYGGVNYGFGYYGSGFYGGRWEGNVFRYNTAVWSVNSTVIHNTYVDRTVINNRTVNNHVSFNGPGGTTARPSPGEAAAARDHHIEATPAQRTHEQEARKDRNQHYSVNHGQPNTAVQTTAGVHPAAARHEAAHPVAAPHEAAHPGAAAHAAAHPGAAAHAVAHPTAAHPAAAPHAAARPATAHHEAAHTAPVHHEATHTAPVHHEAAHHAAPQHPSKPQPKKPSNGGEKKEKK